VLADYSVSRLRMRELSFFRGEFEGWTEDKRKTFLQALFDVLKRDVSAFLGTAISIRDFESVSPENRTRLHDPYFACLQVCVHDAAAQRAEEPEGTGLDIPVCCSFRARLVFPRLPERLCIGLAHEVPARDVGGDASLVAALLIHEPVLNPGAGRDVRVAPANISAKGQGWP